jgi:hypothetical protein
MAEWIDGWIHQSGRQIEIYRRYELGGSLLLKSSGYAVDMVLER